MLIRSQITTLLHIFCELPLYSQVIFKSIKVADDTSKSNSDCEWVKICNNLELSVQAWAQVQL